MEPPKSDAPKLPDMVMCGDHPSITKTELNAKEAKPEEKKDKPKERVFMSYARVSPTSSRTEPARVTSEHALQALRQAQAQALLDAQARRARRVQPEPAQAHTLTPAPGLHQTPPPNKALVQAALGSLRWPPYLLVVWVVVLVLAHALHCLATVLENALPTVKKLCQYFRTWTEETWKTDSELNQRVYPAGLACVTGLLYALHFALYVAHCVVLWAIEPLCHDEDARQAAASLGDLEGVEAKVTNYIDQVNSNTSNNL